MPPQYWLLGVLSLIALTFSNTSAKIYDRCELARELHDRFKFSKRDLDKWLCLAYWESRFDTRAYHKGRYDGSGDHGIFQINDKYWCQPYTGYSENVCKVPCYMLRDDNLEDDIQCVNKIFRRHGFHAWMMFTHKCSGNTLEFFNGCDIKSRKGPLPRFDAEASTVSSTYVRRPNQTEEMQSSASSHEASRTSAEESIHNSGATYNGPSRYTASPGGYAFNQGSPVVQNNLFRQASIPSSIHIPSSHMGAGVSLVSPSLESQNIFLGGQSLTSPAFSSLGGSSLSFPPDMSLFSPSLSAQASQLSSMGIEAPKLAGRPQKTGMIQRLQGALRPSLRGPFKAFGHSVRAAESAPGPVIAAPIIPGYGAPILVPMNHPNSNLQQRKGQSTSLLRGSSSTKRPADPLIAALNAPFSKSSSSQPSKKKRKPASDSSVEEDDEDEDDKKKKK